MACPQCRYTQSWNVVGSQRNLAQLIAGGIGLLAGVGLVIYWMVIWDGGFWGKLFDSACLGFWVAVGIGLLVYVVVRQAVRLYNPNGRKTVDKVIAPRLSQPDVGEAESGP